MEGICKGKLIKYIYIVIIKDLYMLLLDFVVLGRKKYVIIILIIDIFLFNIIWIFWLLVCFRIFIVIFFIVMCDFLCVGYDFEIWLFSYFWLILCLDFDREGKC